MSFNVSEPYWKPRPHVALNILFKHRLGANFLRESDNTPSKSGNLEKHSRFKAISVEENCHDAEYWFVTVSTEVRLRCYPRKNGFDKS